MTEDDNRIGLGTPAMPAALPWVLFKLPSAVTCREIRHSPIDRVKGKRPLCLAVKFIF